MIEPRAWITAAREDLRKSSGTWNKLKNFDYNNLNYDDLFKDIWMLEQSIYALCLGMLTMYCPDIYFRKITSTNLLERLLKYTKSGKDMIQTLINDVKELPSECIPQNSSVIDGEQKSNELNIMHICSIYERIYNRVGLLIEDADKALIIGAYMYNKDGGIFYE